MTTVFLSSTCLIFVRKHPVLPIFSVDVCHTANTVALIRGYKSFIHPVLEILFYCMESIYTLDNL